MQRRLRAFAIVAVGAGSVLAATAAAAHHSYAMFDRNRPVSVTGVVQEFKWNNPHCFIDLMQPGGKGVYTVEAVSVNAMLGKGWHRDSMKPGDKVTVVVWPLKDGSQGGKLVKAMAADGMEIGKSDE